MNGGMLALSGLMLLGWAPDIYAAEETTYPNLFICKQIGWSWLELVYSVLLFCAFISTCVTLIYTMILRVDKKFFVRANVTRRYASPPSASCSSPSAWSSALPA